MASNTFRDVPIYNNVARIGPVHARRLYSVWRTLNEIQAGVLTDLQTKVQARMAATALTDLFPFIADIAKSEGNNA